MMNDEILMKIQLLRKFDEIKYKTKAIEDGYIQLSTYQKKTMFTEIRNHLRVNREEEIECLNSCISFKIPNSFGWMNKDTHSYARSVLKHTSNIRNEPFSLLSLSAAKSVNLLNYLSVFELYQILILIRNTSLFIRIGPEQNREHYSFSSIIRNLIYSKINEPLENPGYFKDLNLQRSLSSGECEPKPFCCECGFFRRIEEQKCDCILCVFLKQVVKNTPAIEQSSHTIENVTI